MKSIRYSDSLRQWNEGYDLAQRFTVRLPEILTPSADSVDGEWGRDKDQAGRDLVTLRLHDSRDEVVGKFGLDTLREQPETMFQLNRLWLKFLNAQLDRLIEKMKSED